MSNYEIREYSLYLFDLDSTLTESISGKTFPENMHDRQLMSGRQEKIEELHVQGKKLCVVTNQGGAAWGFVDTGKFTLWLENFCNVLDIDKFFICYRDTGEKARASERTIKELTVPEYYKDWDRRKPGPGMLIEAMDHFNVSRENTLMVGDREEDRLAAENCGCSFQWSWEFFGEGPIIV
jgi:HAD superfamily hydrolase (TIGR01662 family)